MAGIMAEKYEAASAIPVFFFSFLSSFFLGLIISALYKRHMDNMAMISDNGCWFLSLIGNSVSLARKNAKRGGDVRKSFEIKFSPSRLEEDPFQYI